LAPLQITGSSTTQYAYWPTGVTIDTTQLAGYVYFRAENSSYANRGFTVAGLDATKDGRVPSLPWLNTSSFQIRCVGVDGKWWGGSMTSTWADVLGSITNMNPQNYDDMGNCWSGRLEDCLP
jgi:hypothetical protein